MYEISRSILREKIRKTNSYLLKVFKVFVMGLLQLFFFSILILLGFRSVFSQKCANTYTLTSSDTCISIMETYFQNTWKMFPIYNGVTCSNLVLRAGQQICVPNVSTPPVSSTSCSYYYQIMFGDTYWSIIYNYFGRSSDLYKQYNGNSIFIQIGQWICLPQSQSLMYQTNAPVTFSNNLGFTGGLDQSPPSTTSTSSAASMPDKHNKFSRFLSLGYVTRPVNSTWDYPLTVDWRARGKLQPIANQGNCSSCWAYASIAAIESAYAIIYNIQINLSEQQIIECTNIKCNGGWSTNALNYASAASLIPTNWYPISSSPGTCRLDYQWWLSSVGYINLVSMYETVNFQGWLGLLLAVQQQPVIVNLHGLHPSFQSYVGGLYADRNCSDNIVDHTVLVVGYNLQGGTPYWILRNSWGVEWGEDGYMRMAITGGKGLCGIHTTPGIYPVVPDLNPCGAINPCGSGKCRVNWLTRKNTCECPNEFIVVTNIDGTQTCSPVKVCSNWVSNPCGVGTCVDDMLGSFYCICPLGFASGKRVDGLTTCVPSIMTSQSSVYKIQPEDTCYLIAIQFSISMNNLQKNNPSLNCDSLIIGTEIIVSPSTSSLGCSVSYAINLNDTCTNIQTLFNLNQDSFFFLNPSLNCSNLVPAQQICVAPGPFPGVPICTAYQVAYPGDTCQSIIASDNLTPLQFFAMNPGLYCSRLSLDNSTLTPGGEVCISSNPPGRCACSTGRYYYVREGDTCSRIIINYYNSSPSTFKDLNCNMACATPILYVGQSLCRP